MGPNTKDLKLELGEKLDLCFMVKFHGKLNGDSFDALKRCLNTEMNHDGPKSKISAKKKLDHRFTVKLHGKWNDDNLEALKRCLDPKMDHEGLIWAKIAG